MECRTDVCKLSAAGHSWRWCVVLFLRGNSREVMSQDGVGRAGMRGNGRTHFGDNERWRLRARLPRLAKRYLP